MKKQRLPDNSARTDVPQRKYARFVSSDMRSDGGPGFWLTCDRPFAEAATDLFLAAARANKPVPTVLTSRVPTP